MPRVLAVCEDPTVIGAPFYLMERVHGEVLTSALPPALDTPAQRRRCGEELVDALVEIHAVDWRACGLEGFSSDPGGYLERQLRRFGGLWERHRTRDVPAVERGRRVAVASTCRGRVPRRSCTATTGSATRCCRPPRPRGCCAIFDWELATLGDPLADVGYLCALWSERDDPAVGRVRAVRA